MLRKTFIATVILASLIGCRPPATTRTPNFGKLGDNTAILKPVFDTALAGYQLENAELFWSGADTEEEFNRRGSVTVKDADQRKVAELMDEQIDKLPVTHQWKSYGNGRSITLRGDSYTGFTYKTDVGKYYVDFIFTQVEKDVNIFVLSKGVKR